MLAIISFFILIPLYGQRAYISSSANTALTLAWKFVSTLTAVAFISLNGALVNTLLISLDTFWHTFKAVSTLYPSFQTGILLLLTTVIYCTPVKKINANPLEIVSPFL